LCRTVVLLVPYRRTIPWPETQHQFSMFTTIWRNFLQGFIIWRKILQITTLNVDADEVDETSFAVSVAWILLVRGESLPFRTMVICFRSLLCGFACVRTRNRKNFVFIFCFLSQSYDSRRSSDRPGHGFDSFSEVKIFVNVSWWKKETYHSCLTTFFIHPKWFFVPFL